MLTLDLVIVYLRSLFRKRSFRFALIAFCVVYFVWNLQQVRRERDRVARYQRSFNNLLRNEAKLKKFIVETGKKKARVQVKKEEDDSEAVAAKYLVVKCDKDYENLVDCHDWSLMLKSIYSGFWMARIFNRTFSINIQAPCDLSRFYRPGRIKWDTLPDPDKLTSKLVYQVDDQRMPMRLTHVDLNELRGLDDANAQMLTFLTNRNYGDKLARNTNAEVRQTISELVKRENKNLTIQDGFPALYDELFEMQDPFREKYDRMMVKLRKARSGSKLICIELNLTPGDKARRVRQSVETRDIDLQLMKTVWNFTRQQLVGNLTNFLADNQGYTLFLSTDHVRAVHETIHEFVNQTDVVNNWGVEMTGSSSSEEKRYVNEDRCQSFERTLLDFHAWAHCDSALIMGQPSELSKLALYRVPEVKKGQLLLYRFTERGQFERIKHVDNLLTI